MKIVRIAAAAMAVALSARAENGRVFGDTGVAVPSGSLSFVHSTFLDTLSLSPALQYFVAPDFAVGIGLLYSHGSFTGQPTFNVYGGSASVGYNFRLAKAVSLFPQIEFTAQHAFASSPGAGGTYWSLQAFLPVLFHPAQHFFLGIGPPLRGSG
jgi:hypothetical protein